MRTEDMPAFREIEKHLPERRDEILNALKEALAYCKENGHIFYANQNLGGMMIWERTPQGHKYWQEIAASLL